MDFRGEIRLTSAVATATFVLMFDSIALTLIVAVSVIHLAIAVKVLLPLARPQVNLPATLQAMSDTLQDTIQQEVKRLDDRVMKRRERDIVDMPRPERDRPPVVAGVAYRKP